MAGWHSGWQRDLRFESRSTTEYFAEKIQSQKQYAGHGGGQVVRVLAFYFNDPSSIPAEIKKICEIVEKNENKQKEAGIVQF